MENVICAIRDVYRAIAELETQFQEQYNMSFNEAMLLCSLIKTEQLSSGEIAEVLGLSNSNASKIIKNVEKKGFIKRMLGSEDKRQMYFSITQKGKTKIEQIHNSNIPLPNILQTLLID